MIRRPLLLIAMPLALAASVGLGRLALAQSGIINTPTDSSGSFEVGGISVDMYADSAEDARQAGWKLAQRKGWAVLSQRLTGRATSLSDGSLDAIVSGILIEREDIGPDRYIARLGVLFDRNKAASILGVSARMARSAPMLVLPLQWSGGVGTIFERKTPWNEAWDRFRTGDSIIDYVRPTGTGPDPLLLNEGQVERRGRGWWRTTLSQYGVSDVLIPEVRIRRQWPGGPIVATFIAGHGPDDEELGRFSLRVANGDGLRALLDEGIKRLDTIYANALSNGAMGADSGLSPPPQAQPDADDQTDDSDVAEPDDSDNDVVETSQPAPSSATFNLQFDTPSAGSVTASEAALRGVPGVSSATTTSLALGGVSVMRVTYQGSIADLRSALEARGYQVQAAGNTLRIRRAGGGASPSDDGTVGNASGG